MNKTEKRIRLAAQRFAQRRKGKCNELRESQAFWLEWHKADLDNNHIDMAADYSLKAFSETECVPCHFTNTAITTYKTSITKR